MHTVCTALPRTSATRGPTDRGTWVGWKDPLTIDIDIKKWDQSHASTTLIHGQ